jgi:uncharacterized membrane protein
VTDPRGRGLPGPSTGITAPPSAGLASPAGGAGLERTIARLLTIGTYASIALLVVGAALMIGNGIGPLSGGPAFDLGRLAPDLTAFRPAGVIWLGLVVVVATPAARVAASLVGYARRGERTMAIVAALILLVIALSVALAKGLEG